MNDKLLELLAPELRASIEGEWRKLSSETKRLDAENKILREQLRLMQIEKYGAKSEQLSNVQLALLDVEPGVTVAEVESEAELPPKDKTNLNTGSKKRPSGRAELPPHLPRIEAILTCTEEQCRCANCGGETKFIGYDVSEELDVKPAEYHVKVTKREKRACPCCEECGVAAAPLPPKIVEKGKASNEIVVDVILKKYRDHTPLYRQSAILESDFEIEISRSTLCDWVMTGGQWLEAINRELRADLLKGSYIQADETTVGVQTKEKTGSNHSGYIWQYSRPGGPVVFDFQMGRGREGPLKFLEKFDGYLQCDGYSAYDKIGGDGITFAGCMAHMRRGFVDALKVAPEDKRVLEIIEMIGELYAVEREAREAQMNPDQRLALRTQKSAPQLPKLKEKIIKARKEVLPKSAFGKACDYALSQWERIAVYVKTGEVEIDNNWCENAMRPTVLGRKNWLHIGSKEAGPRIAAIMSVIETCRRLGINERQYLNEVLPKLPNWPTNRVAELTPMAWHASRTAK